MNYLLGRGHHARRKAKSGAKDKADIELSALDWLVVEAKNWKGAGLAGWVDEAVAEAANAGAEVGVVWHHRARAASPGGGYVTMTGEHFARILDKLMEGRRAAKED